MPGLWLLIAIVVNKPTIAVSAMLVYVLGKN
jgi:hypothetical protein